MARDTAAAWGMCHKLCASERDDGKHRLAAGDARQHARRRRVPRGNRGRDAQPATSFDDVGAARTLQETDAQHDKGDEQQHEHKRRRAVGAERSEHHDTSEYAPGNQIPSDRGTRRAGLGSEVDAEPGNEERGEGEPERAVGAKGGGAEGIAAAELPHAGQQLRGAAIENGQANDHSDVAEGENPCIHETEDECSEREAGEAEWTRIGDLDVCHDENSSLGWKTTQFPAGSLNGPEMSRHLPSRRGMVTGAPPSLRRRPATALAGWLALGARAYVNRAIAEVSAHL